MIKKIPAYIITVFFQFLLLVLLSGCKNVDEAKNDTDEKPPTGQAVEIDVNFSFADAAVKFPSPATVHLETGGRFVQRFQGNSNYLHFLYDNYGQEMVEAFASRHYAPGKLLERMWDGEYAGKWLDAATRTAVNTGDEALLKKVDQFTTALINHQQPDGYMGIKLPANRELNDWEMSWDLWNQWNSMIGYLTHYEFRNNSSSLEAASKIGNWIVNEYGVDKESYNKFIGVRVTGGFTNVVVIGQMMRLYRHTGKKEYLDFVKQIIDMFPPIQQMLSTGEPYLFHPYMLGAVLIGVVEYSSATKDKQMLAKVEHVWDELVRTHMFPTGSLGERENLDDEPIKDVIDGQLQETCATTEWIFFTMTLYEITGREKYIEALEKTSYNALIGAQSEDGMKWCYWMPLRYSKHFLHGPTRCCFWSGPKGIARIPQLIYAMKGNTIYVNFFESSTAKLVIPGGDVKIKQDSDFPESGGSSIIIQTPSGWKGELRLRVPEGAKNFSATLNEDDVSRDNQLGRYLVLHLEGSQKYQIDVEFNMTLEMKKLDDGYIMLRGPEVLSLDTRDNIDTWLGRNDDLITLPAGISLLPLDSGKRFQWAGPVSSIERRRYLVEVNDARTAELRGVVLTPYADAGNEGAAFRTAFPRETASSYPSSWKD
jgi:DUF1680 family protein